MAEQTDPELAAARHRLGIELKSLRVGAAMSGADLADALGTGWSQSKVSRIEQARVLPSRADVEVWVDFFQPPEELKRRLLEISDDVGRVNWRNSTGVGLTRRQQDFIDLERAAVSIRHYNPVLLPGYMQTEAYARRVIQIAGAVNAERQLESRLSRRSTVLMPGAPTYRIVLMETCIRWRPVSTPEMADQLDFLHELAQRGNVDLRVIPLNQLQRAYVQHPLMIFTFGEGVAEQALVETSGQDYKFNRGATVDNLSYHFQELSSSALSRDASLEFIHAVARDFRDGD